METLEQLEGVSKALGWSKEVVDSAKKTITCAIKVLSQDSKIAEALKKRLAKSTSAYATHISILSYLSCCLISLVV
jgi:hypothetical protein